MIRHLFCTVRDCILSVLCDPCPCPQCAADRDIEWRAEELADEAEQYANEGEL